MCLRWNFLHRVFCIILVLHFISNECMSLNLEGLALLKLRSRLEVDPYGAMENWDPRDNNPCNWNGIRCNNGKVILLNLENLSLEGTLAPEIREIQHLRALLLRNNKLSGGIPEELIGLPMLELLDLRNNNMTGKIPPKIRQMQSLRLLLLCNNKFHGARPIIERATVKFDLESDMDHSCHSDAENDNFNHETRPMLRADLSFRDHQRHGENLQGGLKDLYMLNKGSVHVTRRRLLENAAAAPSSLTPTPSFAPVPQTGSGSFSVFINGNPRKRLSPSPAPSPILSAHAPEVSTTRPHTPSGIYPAPARNKGPAKWVYAVVLPVVVLLLTVVACFLLVSRAKGVTAVATWRSGISGQLQKAFVTGVPKLNRLELVAACEDFSNIVTSYSNFTMYKGTLSSGVEIAVVSTAVSCAKEWTQLSEHQYRKKIETLSRINHKNFVNLLGYCEEEEPFMRMMVLEYAPNGTLYEHLHVEEFEHVDWTSRMRITMGIAYCIQYMHELSPPISHPDLQSTSILLSEDYAAKVVDMSVWKEVVSKPKSSWGEGDGLLERHSVADPSGNVYSFGILMLEIISGKLPYSQDDGLLTNLALECLNEGQSIASLLDPTIKAHNDHELNVICELIQQCIDQDLKKRPKIKDITSRLKETLKISAEAATPRLSPLWWAELEILSVEAS
ncbi:hypothetical protein LUZ60_008170 [Juncus effusus]|nr:hypothetical protein LUZ60_008170 [Juncus effusus]